MSKRHERLLFRYSSALERGDFDAVAAVLREAERDPALEQMILEINEAYAAEQAGSTNHIHSKEYPMIASLYQQQYQNQLQPRQQRQPIRWQNFTFAAAALALVAFVGISLVVQSGVNHVWYAGQGGSPAPAVAAQVSPACSTLIRANAASQVLYSRPSLDALVIAEISGAGSAGRAILLLDKSSINGQNWVYVQLPAAPPSSPDAVQGWLPEENFGALTEGCQAVGVALPAVQATVAPIIVSRDQIAATAAQYAVVEATRSQDQLLMSATALIIEATRAANASVLALPPTVVPMDAAPLGVVASPAAPQVIAYTVQPGDTLLSILMRFNLPASAALEVLRLNNLPEDTLPAPGTALLLPVANCPTQVQRPLNVWLGASTNTPVIALLPAGATIQVVEQSQQPDGNWLMITAQVQGVNLSGGWVRADLLGISVACLQNATVAAEAVPAQGDSR